MRSKSPILHSAGILRAAAPMGSALHRETSGICGANTGILASNSARANLLSPVGTKVHPEQPRKQGHEVLER
jgi:hypothetical protein